MNPPSPDKITPRSTSGAIFGAAAFLIWGISPLYWKTLTAVPALEIVAHRVVWSFLLLMPLILIRKRWKEFLLALTNWRSMAILAATSLFVSCNWLVYIWAINNGFLLQASLGYYINPLVNVLLGTLFLKERLRSFQGLGTACRGRCALSHCRLWSVSLDRMHSGMYFRFIWIGPQNYFGGFSGGADHGNFPVDCACPGIPDLSGHEGLSRVF